MGNRKEITIPQKYIDKYGDENGRLPLWSYSKVSSVGSDSCHWEYYLSRIKKLSGVSNSYAILGGFAHDILEEYYNGNIKYEEMKDNFEAKWLEAEMLGIKLYNDKEKNTKMMEEYKHDLLNFFETHKDLGRVLTERELWVDIKGNIFFGYSDALTKKEDGYTYIIDWKTSTLYKGDQIRQHQHQLLLYSLALAEMGIPLDKIKICWNFLKYTNIRFKHMTTVTYLETVKDKTKSKTSTCLKHEWVSKIKTQLKKDIISFYDNEGVSTLSSKDLKSMLDKCVLENSLKSLPVEIQNKYELNDVIKTARRNKWTKESSIQSQLRKDLKLSGIDDVTIEIKLVECAESNTLEPISDLLDISNYVLEDAYIYGIINEETINELKKSLCENIELIKSKGDNPDNWERLLPIGEQESFYCSVLCSQRKNCKYYDQYKKEKERYTVDGFSKTNDMSNDNLLEELMNL